MTVLRHDDISCLDAGMESDEVLRCLYSETMQLLDMQVIDFCCKRNDGAVNVAFCVFEGATRPVHNLGQFWDMSVSVQSDETISNKLTMLWVVLGL